MHRENTKRARARRAIVALRIGLAFVFLYPAIAGLINPDAYTKWIPDFVLKVFPFGAHAFLVLFFFVEIFLVAWLFSGKRGFEAGVASALLLIIITAPNLDAIGTLFRNVGLIAAAAALAFLEWNKSIKN